MPSEQTATTGTEQLAVLIQESQRENQQIQRELKEIDVLIRQSTAEVEKLAQRNSQLASRVRTMEVNMDTYPRNDIKELYSVYHEAQMRLFMMRGQLEQLQHRQQALEQQSHRVQQVVELASQVAPGDLANRAGGGVPAGQRDIVRVIEAQENERHRLAQQMHDGPAQSLTNLILQAEICERLFDSDPVQARLELGNLKNAVYGTYQKIRHFIGMLRPMMLDDLGLVPALKQYIDEFEDKARLSTHLTVLGREARLPPTIEVALFRMIQELLTNAQMHAHAARIQVTLDYQQEAILTSVEDDGSGFDVNEIQNPARQRRGLGLATIRERAEMLGGGVQVESRIGRGTRVRIEIPVPSQSQ